MKKINRNYQKIISIIILLSFTIFALPVLASEGLEISLSSTEANQGSTATLILTIDNQPVPISSMDFTISYDTSKFSISKNDIEWDDLFDNGWDVRVGFNTPGEVHLYGISSKESEDIANAIPPVQVAKLKFTVDKNADYGQSVPITFVRQKTVITKIKDDNSDTERLNLTLNDGSIKINKRPSSGGSTSDPSKYLPSTSPSTSPTTSPTPTPTTSPDVTPETSPGASPTTPSTEPGTTSGPTSVDDFKDVGEEYSWARSSIDHLVKAGIISGKTEDTFEPGADITRAEFCKLLSKAFGFTEKDESKSFNDVNSEDWHYEFVMAAAKAGVVTGYEDGGFKPNDKITREEMAAMLVRSFKAAGISVPEGELSFTDKDQVAQWATNYVASLVKMGIISGRTDGSFDPKNNLIRAETAKVIYTAYALLTAGAE